MNAPAAIPNVQSIPLEKLRPGHKHPLCPANPRKRGHEVGLDELAGLIYRDGQLQAGRAFPAKDSDHFYVYIGERRLLALQLNADTHMDASRTMDIYVDDIEPLEALHRSMSEQDRQLPLHPVERY